MAEHEDQVPAELVKAALDGVPAPRFIESKGWQDAAQILHGPEEGEPTVASREQQDHAIRRFIGEHTSDLGQTIKGLAQRGRGRRL